MNGERPEPNVGVVIWARIESWRGSVPRLHRLQNEVSKMHFMGQQAISRPTRGTSRILLSLSFAIFFIKFYGVQLENLNFYGVRLPPDLEYLTAQVVIMLFILTSHVVNWFGDHISYQGWNIEAKVTTAAGFGSDTALVTRLDSVIRIVKEKIGNEQEHNIILERLDEIRCSVLKVNSYAWWYIYFWHLFVPIVASITAVFWSGSFPLMSSN